MYDDQESGMAADQDESAEFSTVDAGMAEKPASDPIAMERSRARVELAMFGRSRPAMLGRYQILDPIAGGGMGLVYAAYDPQLDRKVALKVLHPDVPQHAHAHARLLKEARALARLDHPNVVAVHDILSTDGQIVVVMALLEGETVESWQTSAVRDWTVILDAYAQAGEGLAAAHSVDVVHRDFKPSNVIIGPDGHVRVLDFGLARLASDGNEAGVAGRFAPPTSHTVAGAFVGTLAYAAPEQLAGTTVTPASDQFSFCVALHRAIEGVSPFAGTSLPELLASIERDPVRVASDGRRIPAWLRQMLRRGLSIDPAQRFASMSALLEELRRPRGWKRWRWPAVTFVLVAGAAGGAAALRGSGSVPPCDGGASRVAAVWGTAERSAVTQRLEATSNPFARDIEARVADGLDELARGWSVVHRDACLAHRRGAESDALLDKKMRCLDRELGDLREAVAVLQQVDDLDRAVDVVVGIPPADWCANAVRLQDAPDPPPTVALDREVRRIRDQLGRAAALDHVGRSEEALSLARDAANAARRTGYQAAIAEAELHVGRILIGRSELGAAIPVLEASRQAALSTGHDLRIAVEAGARLIFVEGSQSPDLDRLDRDLAYLIPMSSGLVGDHFARPLLFNNAAQIFRIALQPDKARDYLRRAKEALGSNEPDIELTMIDSNLATLTTDPVERMRLAGNVYERVHAVLGDHHLRTLQARAQYAVFQQDLTRADDLLAPVCAEYRQAHPELVDVTLDCEGVHAFIAAELGRADEARRAYEAIIAAAAATPSTDHEVYRQLAVGELALSRGDLGPAGTAFHAVIQIRGTAKDWWEKQDAFQAELGLGIAAIAEHHPAIAREHLEAARAGYDDVVRANPGIMFVRRADDARRLLASLPERDRGTSH